MSNRSQSPTRLPHSKAFRLTRWMKTRWMARRRCRCHRLTQLHLRRIHLIAKPCPHFHWKIQCRRGRLRRPPKLKLRPGAVHCRRYRWPASLVACQAQFLPLTRRKRLWGHNSFRARAPALKPWDSVPSRGACQPHDAASVSRSYRE